MGPAEAHVQRPGVFHGRQKTLRQRRKLRRALRHRLRRQAWRQPRTVHLDTKPRQERQLSRRPHRRSQNRQTLHLQRRRQRDLGRRSRQRKVRSQMADRTPIRIPARSASTANFFSPATGATNPSAPSTWKPASRHCASTVGLRPNEMALATDGRLFVSCAGDNTVHVIQTQAPTDTDRDAKTNEKAPPPSDALEIISTSLYASSPEGSTPDARRRLARRQEPVRRQRRQQRRDGRRHRRLQRRRASSDSFRWVGIRPPSPATAKNSSSPTARGLKSSPS